MCVFDQHAKQVPSLIKDAIGQQQVVVARLRPGAEGEAGFALHAMIDDLGRGSALTALGAAMRLVTGKGSKRSKVVVLTASAIIHNTCNDYGAVTL